MYRFNECIKQEIYNAINIWTEGSVSSEKLDDYFEDTCSIWNGYEELKFYLEEDGEEIDIKELKKEDWCVQLSDGRVMMLG